MDQQQPTPVDSELTLGRRAFVGAVGAVAASAALGGAASPAAAAHHEKDVAYDADKGEYVLPPLPYDYDALEPHIDAETMRLHHDLHHNGYVKGLNKTLVALEVGEVGGRMIATRQRMSKVDAPEEWTEMKVESMEWNGTLVSRLRAANRLIPVILRPQLAAVSATPSVSKSSSVLACKVEAFESGLRRACASMTRQSKPCMRSWQAAVNPTGPPPTTKALTWVFMAHFPFTNLRVL